MTLATLTELIAPLTASPWFSLIGWLISVVLSVVFYLKSKKEKRPVFGISTTLLIKNLKSRYAKLRIEMDAVEISSLSVTKIYFWNEGKETIDKTDISTIAPLKIIADPDTKILSCDLLKFSSNSNNVSITPAQEGKEYKISFNYLDPSQGFAMQILHDGESKKPILIIGDIKGHGRPKQIQLNARDDIVPVIVGGFFSTWFGYALISSLARAKSENPSTIIIVSIIAIVFIIVSILVYYALYVFITRTRSIPKDLL